MTNTEMLQYFEQFYRCYRLSPYGGHLTIVVRYVVTILPLLSVVWYDRVTDNVFLLFAPLKAVVRFVIAINARSNMLTIVFIQHVMTNNIPWLLRME